MKFKFLEGIAIADVAFEAYGKSLEEAFENAALAMFEVQVDTKKVGKKLSKTVKIEAENKEALLLDWLSELLYLRDVNNMFFAKFDVKISEKNKRFFLKGKVCGEKINRKKHQPKTEVKAASYHMMKIEKNGEYKVRVILDV
jgi:SHS2 domain-containing protein